MYNNHKAVVKIIEELYHVFGCKCVDDLNYKQQCSLAISILQDFDYFDPAEMILYDTDHKETIRYLMEELYLNENIDSSQFAKELIKLIMKRAKSRINEIFDEIIEYCQEKVRERNIDFFPDFVKGFY